MTNYTCAVGDCTSDSRKSTRKTTQGTNNVKGYARFPSAKKESRRRKIWERSCRRPGGWKATANHVICSLHFLEWNNGPSPEHPDPVLFSYNGWGRNHLAVINRKKNSLQCQGQNVISEPKGPNNTSTSTQCNIETLFPQEEVLAQHVQDWVEVEVCTTTEDSGTTIPDESCNVWDDHTYGASTQSETFAESVDVAVQTDQCRTLKRASQTHEQVHEDQIADVDMDDPLKIAAPTSKEEIEIKEEPLESEMFIGPDAFWVPTETVGVKRERDSNNETETAAEGLCHRMKTWHCGP
ncbi:uncharacterized protein LOC143035233 isoform X2 [Oratosquilla oratoria]|uniref:uncharacterized protein LOC143035233 isoform X2 n=1 Tax=Oratosquilla oratoria TaxID=337810 RepID=UPI003F7667C1